MKTSRYIQAQILAILRQAEAGMPVAELCPVTAASGGTMHSVSASREAPSWGRWWQRRSSISSTLQASAKRRLNVTEVYGGVAAFLCDMAAMIVPQRSGSSARVSTPALRSNGDVMARAQSGRSGNGAQTGHSVPSGEGLIPPGRQGGFGTTKMTRRR